MEKISRIAHFSSVQLCGNDEFVSCYKKTTLQSFRVDVESTLEVTVFISSEIMIFCGLT